MPSTKQKITHGTKKGEKVKKVEIDLIDAQIIAKALERLLVSHPYEKQIIFESLTRLEEKVGGSGVERNGADE